MIIEIEFGISKKKNVDKIQNDEWSIYVCFVHIPAVFAVDASAFVNKWRNRYMTPNVCVCLQASYHSHTHIHTKKFRNIWSRYFDILYCMYEWPHVGRHMIYSQWEYHKNTHAHNSGGPLKIYFHFISFWVLLSKKKKQKKNLTWFLHVSFHFVQV